MVLGLRVKGYDPLAKVWARSIMDRDEIRLGPRAVVISFLFSIVVEPCIATALLATSLELRYILVSG